MSRSAPGPEPGTYALLLRTWVPGRIRIGRLGSFPADPAWLVYVGSALGSGGVRGRLCHHQRRARKPRWHVDWLRRRATLHEIWWTRDPRRREHDWAARLAARRDAEIPLSGFGSSDCDCRSHLLRFRRRPAVGSLRRRLRASDPDHAPVSLWRPPLIETPRLRLREMHAGDLDAVAGMLGDPDVMRFWPRPFDREEAREWVHAQRRRYVDDGFGYWLALHRDSGEAVGQVGVLTQRFDGAGHLGLGYLFCRRWWGSGLATEAAAACRDWAFRELGAGELTALIRPENTASARLARRLGLRRRGSTRHADLEHDIYALPRDEAGVNPSPP